MQTDRWVAMMVVVTIIGLLMKSVFLLALPVTVLIILGLARWWQNNSLSEVVYRRRFHYIRAFPGESFPLKLEIENNKFLPLTWLRVQDPWPEMVPPEGEDVLAPSFTQGQGLLTNVFSLRWFQRTHRNYQLDFRQRGVFKVGPARLSSGDIFGIYEVSKLVGEREELTVFPKMIPLERIGLQPEDPFGDQRSSRRLFEDPNRPIGVREYHREDGFRRVHWPATAHTGQLQVKVFQPISAQVMMMCMNISTYERYWEGVNPELMEHMLSVAATLLAQGLELGYRVGMISNGCLTNSDQPFRIPPGRSPKQLAHLLQALAGVTPLVFIPFDNYLLQEIPRVPYGASLFILTSVVYPSLIDTLMRIKKHERRIILYSISDKAPPHIPGIRSIHAPLKPEQPLDLPSDETVESEVDRYLPSVAQGNGFRQ